MNRSCAELIEDYDPADPISVYPEGAISEMFSLAEAKSFARNDCLGPRVRFGETKAATSEPGAKIAEERSRDAALQAHQSVAR